MDDAQIVQLYWDRDEQAIPATSEKYGNYCTSIAMNILGNQEDAEECVNDTYLNAWNAMPPHRPSILPTFLGKITRNLSFNRYKHHTADKRGGGEMPAVLEELSDLVSGRDDVEQAFDQRELTKAIDTFLDGLSPKKGNSRKPLIHFWMACHQRKEAFLSVDTGTPTAFQKLPSGTI